MTTAGERRIVSVLISDLVDSTSIAEKLGPERSKFLFDEIVGLMAAEVRRFEGTVAQLTGDGLLALFGAPVAHGDDAERAVRAALAIHEAFARYAADVAGAYGIALEARVAVNTGPVVVPALDVPPDVLYNALGDTVNVAARLQPSAGAGGVVIGPATARELAGRFELESLGELELKGKTEPVAAYRVTGEAQAETVHESPLVGRERELASLVEALSRLDEGLGTIVSVTGEPGIGKSRLVTEALSRAASDVRFLVANAASYTSNAPFWPVRDLLRGWLGVGVADPEGRVRLELKAAVAAVLDGQADSAYPFLASLLGLSLDGADEERLNNLSRDSVQRQTFEAVAMLFVALARERPLCLVFEDLHWADESTLALVEDLLDLADREATVLVLLYRSERDHGAWHLGEVARQRFPHRLVELELRSLAPQESVQLAVGAAGAELPAEVSELLTARSGGNPFFLEEALRDLVERGVLQPVNAHWELTIAADELTVPLLVQETLQARLDRLEPGTREVASIAAVIGGRFGIPLLERLADPVSLPAALSELQRLDLVVEERRRPVREYRFRHGLVQEVAYGALTEARRRELHRAAGEALEELRAEALEEVYEPLARHFTQAGDAEKAVHYLLAAGDAAWALYADRPALEHYRRALEFMGSDDPRARPLLCKIALAHHLDFDYAAADAAWASVSVATRPPRRTANERLVTSLLAGAEHVWAPGHTYEFAGWWLASGLFSGLLRIERGLNLVPDAAARLSVSADGLRYRARLRPDTVWSDDTPLTADDFVYAWREIQEHDLPTAHLLDDIAEATALDAETLEIRLHEPRAHFPYLLALPPLFPWPRHACERLGDGWIRPPEFVGNGAFVLAERDAAHSLLIANERWHGDRGNVGEVLVRLLADREEINAAWARGELDLQITPWGQGAEVAHAESSAWLSTELVGFVVDAPPFDDVRVRRAFAHAIDRGRLVQEREAAGEPASGGFVPPAMPGHSHRIGLDHDPARARALLAEAGFPGGRGLPEIRLAEAFSRTAESVAEQWRDELQAQVTVVSFPFDGDPRDLDPPAACWLHGWTADFPDPGGFLMPALKSESGHTAALYRPAEVLEELKRFLQARGRDERLSIVEELERTWLGEFVAMVPVVYSSQLWRRRPTVENFWTTPILPGHLSDIVIRR
jgi:ABC-type transport system substrate-binding protein/class 3 adenylate cyclase